MTMMPFNKDGALAVTPLNQEPYDDSRDQAEGDPRLVEYLDASSAGDRKTMDALRAQWADDPPLINRFNTVDDICIRTMRRYELEIQVLRKEVWSWEKLSDGYEALHDDNPDGERENARLWIRQGLKGLERTVAARKELGLEDDLGISPLR